MRLLGLFSVFLATVRPLEHGSSQWQAAFAQLSLSNDIARDLDRQAYTQARLATREQQEQCGVHSADGTEHSSRSALSQGFSLSLPTPALHWTVLA